MADEELAASRVLPRVGHGERTRDVLVHVAVRLALDRVARPTGADAALAALRIGVAPLDHEVGDHAVELRSVIKPGIGELLEVGHGGGGFVAEQLQHDRAPHGLHHPLFDRHQRRAERFSSTCATVFIPTSTTETVSLSSTNLRASWAAVTPACCASSRTRWPSAASCATWDRGVRPRMSPFDQAASAAYCPPRNPLPTAPRATPPTLAAA